MAQNYHPTLVWQPLLRVLHWIIAISVSALIPLGVLLAVSSELMIPKSIRHSLLDVHAVAGFVFATALALRIVYMLVSSGTAGWRDVVPHTKAQFALARRTVSFYLAGFRGAPPLYFSHNPFAGIAYTSFFIFAINQAVTGISMFVIHETAASGKESQPEALLALHTIGAVLIILFIFAHLGALALHDIVERRGLASSMLSGYKFFTDEETAELEREKTRGSKG